LTPGEMADRREALNPAFFERDWPRAALRERFGPPSLDVFGGCTVVDCYACEDPTEKWVFFDLAYRLWGARDILPEPTLRDVRSHQSNTMALLPFAAQVAQK